MKNNKIFNFFVFLLIFPFFSVFGNSISFYFFIFLLLSSDYKIIDFKSSKLIFYLLALISIISSFLSFRVNEIINFDTVSSLLILIKYIYWFLLSSYIITHYKLFDLNILSKYIFYGTLSLVFCFFFFESNYSFSVISFKLDNPRNYYVYTLLISFPFSLYYIFRRFGILGFHIGAFSFLIIMLLCEGRSALIIYFIQLLFIYGLMYPKIKKFSILSFSFSIVLLFIFSFNPQNIVEQIGQKTITISPRVGNLILGEGDGDLTFDKSWLIRELMVEKAISISKKYPFIGIGPGNFDNFKSELTGLNNKHRLHNRSFNFYNELSAHNSYFQILSELGIFALVLFLILIFSSITYFLKIYITTSPNLITIPLISLLGISIHFYVISAITGAVSWFLISLCWAIFIDRKRH